MRLELEHQLVMEQMEQLKQDILEEGLTLEQLEQCNDLLLFRVLKAKQDFLELRTRERLEQWSVALREAIAALRERQSSFADYRKGHNPPKYAELLLTAFASKRHAEAMIGDLNERHADWCKSFGARWADRLYWARAVQSIGPLLWRSIVKALKWAVMISTVRRFLGL
jgi:hypothetical protein